VTFYLRDYGHVDHGYAATVHKAQGMTVDRAHVLASGMLDRHGAYVALSRHREGVSLHWSAEEHGDRAGLERGLSRERAKDTTLDYQAEFAELRGLRPVAAARTRAPAPTLAPAQAEQPKRKRAAPRPSATERASPAEVPQLKAQLPAAAPVPPPSVPERRVATWGLRQADEMQERQARSFVASWDAVLASYKAGLPGLAVDPTLGGARRQLEQLAQALEGRPWLAQMLREGGTEFGVAKQQRPELAQVVAAQEPGQVLKSLLAAAERSVQTPPALQPEPQQRSQPGRGPRLGR
jgi:hypothetical protein